MLLQSLAQMLLVLLLYVCVCGVCRVCACVAPCFCRYAQAGQPVLIRCSPLLKLPPCLLLQHLAPWPDLEERVGNDVTSTNLKRHWLIVLAGVLGGLKHLPVSDMRLFCSCRAIEIK